MVVGRVRTRHVIASGDGGLLELVYLVRFGFERVHLESSRTAVFQERLLLRYVVDTARHVRQVVQRIDT